MLDFNKPMQTLDGQEMTEIKTINMNINYNWVISSMEEYPKTADDLTDVVCIIHWRRVATAIVDEKTYTADCYSSLSVPAPNPEDFTPYADLTFEQVCGWLEAGLDTEAIDASLLTQIEQQINPPIISLPLPWNVTTTSTTTVAI